ncbi:hypothetical protein V3F56_13985 [Moorellaceae bacterium AZ2]
MPRDGEDVAVLGLFVRPQRGGYGQALEHASQQLDCDRAGVRDLSDRGAGAGR